MTVYERLAECRDEAYREGVSKLVPNIQKETILGVRTPEMRRIAKEIRGTEEARAFLAALPHRFYEENLVHFFLISMIKDFDECAHAVETFLPYADCWPVSDQASPIAFKRNHERLLPLIKTWVGAEHVYTARFGVRMLMNEFLDKEFKPEYLAWVANVKGEDYYIKMMVAWYFATALAKQYDASVVYIETRRLDPWTHKKAIRKAIESFRVAPAHKEYLKTLR